MDFKRIQLLLIFFFVIFNLYLTYSITQRISMVSIEPNTAIDATIEEELKSRGVTFQDFSDNTEDIHLIRTDQTNYLAENISQLTNQNASIDSDRVLTSTFDQPVDLGIGLSDTTTEITDEQFAYLKQEFLDKSEWFIQGEAYAHPVYNPTDNTIVLRMTDGDGHRIIDGNAELRLQLNEMYLMTGYVQTYQSNITQLETTVEIISEKTAIEILDRRVETLIPDDARIIDTRISFYQSTALNDMNVYSPAWEFIYVEENSSPKSLLIDAHRGTVLSWIALRQN
ncbi:two-component system regulatory protein YycI [Aerococcaceae bacterium DSM 111020]|nr:two-component system regulatory protein YycI [Aerococcaceae bacterium DSM 111020]